MGSIGKLVHDVITTPLSWLVLAHAHRQPGELVSFAITGTGAHVVLVIGINDDNNFLYKIVKITGFFLLAFCVILLQVVQYTNSLHALLLQQERKEIEKAKAI